MSQSSGLVAIERTSNIRHDLENMVNAVYAYTETGTAYQHKNPSNSYDSLIAATISPYNFRFTKRPITYKEAFAERYNIAKLPELEEESVSDSEIWGNMSSEEILDGIVGDDPFFTKFALESTAVGDNEAVNPRWAFNRDDDIIPPVLALGGKPELGGLGRVYHEQYQATQQLLHISLGVPEFKDLLDFYTECVDGNLAQDTNAGGSLNISRMFGSLVGGALSLAIKIPVLPFRFLDWVAQQIGSSDQISKYYELRAAMPMYYRYANSIFSQIAVLMGMTKNAWLLPDSLNLKAETGGETNGAQSSLTLQKLYSGSYDTEQYDSSLPLFMQGCGPNIYAILAKRNKRYDAAAASSIEDLEDYMAKVEQLNTGDKSERGGWFDSWFDSMKRSVHGGDKFVSFRINKGSDSSESLSNSTGQPSIAQTINNMASTGRDTNFSAGGHINKLGAAISEIPVLGSVASAVADFAKGAANSFGVTGLAGAVLTGSGFVDIPDIWTGSSFTKNYSFNMTFRPGAGDNVSILQDCYLPLSMLLAMACPRSVGVNSYTSPFLLRAYCKGMFAVPLGIIDSLSVTRGASEFGWNMSRLPTVINVSMTIKDLAPIMHLSMADTYTGMKIFGANSSMMEYALTLAGCGLDDRLMFSKTFVNRMSLSSHLLRTTYLNPNYHGLNMGHSNIGVIIGGIRSVSLWPTT